MKSPFLRNGKSQSRQSPAPVSQTGTEDYFRIQPQEGKTEHTIAACPRCANSDLDIIEVLNGNEVIFWAECPFCSWVQRRVHSRFLFGIFTLQNTFHWVKSIALADKCGAPVQRGHYKPINSRRFVYDCHEYVFYLTKQGDVALDRLALACRTLKPRWKELTFIVAGTIGSFLTARFRVTPRFGHTLLHSRRPRHELHQAWRLCGHGPLSGHRTRAFCHRGVWSARVPRLGHSMPDTPRSPAKRFLNLSRERS